MNAVTSIGLAGIGCSSTNPCDNRMYLFEGWMRYGQSENQLEHKTVL